MAIVFSSRVVGVGAVATVQIGRDLGFLPYRFSSQEECDLFLTACKRDGATLHINMAHNEMAAMVEQWKQGRTAKRQPGEPLPVLKAPYLRADQVQRTLDGQPLDIADRYKEAGMRRAREIEERVLDSLLGPPASSVNKPFGIDRWLDDGGADIHQPVRSAAVEVYSHAYAHGTYEELPPILKGMAEAVNHEQRGRVSRGDSKLPRDEDFA